MTNDTLSFQAGVLDGIREGIATAGQLRQLELTNPNIAIAAVSKPHADEVVATKDVVVAPRHEPAPPLPPPVVSPPTPAASAPLAKESKTTPPIARLGAEVAAKTPSARPGGAQVPLETPGFYLVPRIDSAAHGGSCN